LISPKSQKRLAEALAVCRSAQAHVGSDPALQLFHATLLQDLGDVVNAEPCLLQVLEGEAERTDALARERRYAARHNLALLCRKQQRVAEAERHWRAAVSERPKEPAAWLGLGELLLGQNRLAEADAALAAVESTGKGGGGTVLLRARVLWKKREHEAARQLLAEALAREPHWLEARRLLSYVLLEEDRDPAAAEAALREVLALEPRDVEARRILALLLGKRAG
jgi:tetratricopeptide (TPR) repeat protein